MNYTVNSIMYTCMLHVHVSCAKLNYFCACTHLSYLYKYCTCIPITLLLFLMYVLLYNTYSYQFVRDLPVNYLMRNLLLSYLIRSLLLNYLLLLSLFLLLLSLFLLPLSPPPRPPHQPLLCIMK